MENQVQKLEKIEPKKVDNWDWIGTFRTMTPGQYMEVSSIHYTTVYNAKQKAKKEGIIISVKQEKELLTVTREK